MAFIHVDGGSSWWGPGGLLRSGVHESVDEEVVEAAVRAARIYDWLSVKLSGEEYAERNGGEAPKPDLVQLTPEEDQSAATGPMTSADLPGGDKPEVTCPFCTDGRVFGTKAALSSHVRNKHDDIDPKTLLPKEEAAELETKQAEQPQPDGQKDVDGGRTQEDPAPVVPVPPAGEQPQEPEPKPAAEPEPEPAAEPETAPADDDDTPPPPPAE